MIEEKDEAPQEDAEEAPATEAPTASEEAPAAEPEEAPAAEPEEAPAAAEEAPAAEPEEAPAPAVEPEEAPAAEEEAPAAEPEEAPAPAVEAEEAAAPAVEAEPPADEPAAEPAEAAAEEAPAAEAQEAPAAEAEEAAAPPPKARPKRDRKKEKEEEPEVIPGAHLEPDLVLDDSPSAREDVAGLLGAEIEAAEQALGDEDAPGDEAAAEAPAPVPTTVLDLAADARYHATGKRKSAVARVVLKPGTGVYTVNGREMAAFFPRPTLQTIVRQPLQAVGQEERMDVVAKIHGGGVSSQAGALRHGISKALTEADPNLRGELKGRGYLTRDARVKERKKAGLKKARKRPQFSKR